MKSLPPGIRTSRRWRLASRRTPANPSRSAGCLPRVAIRGSVDLFAQDVRVTRVPLQVDGRVHHDLVGVILRSSQCATWPIASRGNALMVSSGNA